MATLKLEIVTAESPVFTGEVDSIVAPGTVGQFTILPHHAAFMTMLEAGELCLRRWSGNVHGCQRRLSRSDGR
jgi:F-type H+-transporting ATPase subunit epsilon